MHYDCIFGFQFSRADLMGSLHIQYDRCEKLRKINDDHDVLHRHNSNE